MNKSDSIKNLSIALSKFQGEIKNPNNTAVNPFFKSKYAPLNDVLNLVRPVLAKNGLSVVQAPSGDGENIIVTTTLLHESGEWIEFPSLTLRADKATAQGAGSAITYARRYSLSAVLGISSEDDGDGNQSNTDKKQVEKPKNKSAENNMASEKQLSLIYKLSKERNYNSQNMSNYIKSMYQKNSSKELTKQEASELIEMLQSLGNEEN